MCLVEVVDGRVAKGDKLVAMSSGESWEVGELGLLAPEPTPTGELLTGQVGAWGWLAVAPLAACRGPP